MKNFKRSFLFVIVAALCALAALSFTACGNKTTEGLEYTAIVENEVPVAYSVTGIGTATSSNIVIPARYNGLPVKIISSYAFNGSNIKSVTIPESVTTIGLGAFLECGQLTKLTIPGNIDSMEAMAFAKCTSLKTLTIQDGVTKIGMQAFYGCTSLANVTIPDSVTYFGDQAFGQCTALTNFSIYTNVNYIGYKAFDGCSNLKNVTFSDTVGWKAYDILNAFNDTIPNESLADTATAALYLRESYSAYIWMKG